MKLSWKKYLFLLSTISLLYSSAEAAIFYRHVPFSILMNLNDSLLVNYDFSGKKGIYCTSNNKFSLINFTYKGHPKSAHLPITLQSDHVPQQLNEELADYKGEFTLSTPVRNKNIPTIFKIDCNYGDKEVTA